MEEDSDNDDLYVPETEDYDSSISSEIFYQDMASITEHQVKQLYNIYYMAHKISVFA